MLALFKHFNIHVPSETTLRRHLVTKYSKNISNSVVEKLKEKKVFLVDDETVISNRRYLNILAGSICDPKKKFLIYTKFFGRHVNSGLLEINCDKENFLLLLSDDVSYMRKASINLKVLYPRLFTVKCLARLIHNCAMRIKSNYENVDRLISSSKE